MSVKRICAVLFALVTMVFMASGASAQTHQPGACHWGDAGLCDGNIDPGDYSELQANLLGQAANYSGCIVQCSDVQDLNGDGLMDPGDVAKLQQWFLGNFTNTVGDPVVIDLVGLAGAATICAGDSPFFQARLYDSVTVGNGETNLRSGWGVVFEIDSANTNCSGVYLNGRDMSDGGSIVDAETVFDYTGCVADGGTTGVRLLTDSCSHGDYIEVDSYIPGGDLRFAAGLSGPSVTFNIENCDTVCGDSLCEAPEDEDTCPEDCDFCGNAFCGAFEDIQSCPGDCCQFVQCGDSLCEAPCEDSIICPADCAVAGCGDMVCDPPDEDSLSCNMDCFCGDGICDITENSMMCPEDCCPISYCGNGICEIPCEDPGMCSMDCSPFFDCGDMICDSPAEDFTNCPSDCGCGDMVCDMMEYMTPFMCPPDCTPACMNFICEPEMNEHMMNCQDCWCGDGVCNPRDETMNTCPMDCGP